MALYRSEILRRITNIGIIFLIMVMVDITCYVLIKVYIEGTTEKDTMHLLVDAVYWTFATLSTLGHYPSGVDLHSPVGKLFTVAAVLSGATMLFIAVPYAIAPWVEGKIKEASLLRSPPMPTKGHIIVCEMTPLGREVVYTLQKEKIPVVAVDRDGKAMEDIGKSGVPFVIGDPVKENTLKKAGVEGARALILTGKDEDNAFTALTAKSIRADIPVIARVDDMDHTKIMRKAGVDRAISPTYMLGTTLGRLAVTEYNVDFSGRLALLGDMEIRQYRIGQKSNLAGKDLKDSAIRPRAEVIVIGIWVDGELIINPPSTTLLEPGSILLVLGKASALQRFEEKFFGEGMSS